MVDDFQPRPGTTVINAKHEMLGMVFIYVPLISLKSGGYSLGHKNTFLQKVRH